MIIAPEINIITVIILDKSRNEKNRGYTYFYLSETISNLLEKHISTELKYRIHCIGFLH